MAQGSKRSKKGLLNNPFVLIMILLLFAVVGAMQFGLLDSLFGVAPEPSAQLKPAPSQTTAAANPATPTQATPAPKAGTSEGTSPGTPGDASKSGSGASQATVPAGTPNSAKPASNSGASQAIEPAGSQNTEARAVLPPQGQKAAEAKKPVPQKPKVPEFTFAVGRANPFANLAGVSTGATTSKGPSTGQPVRNSQPVSGDSGKKPDGQAEAKPKDPWETWQYTGLSSYGQLRFAIIQTPTTSYIVKVGDRIEGVWLVKEITSDKIVLRGSSRTLVLVLGGDKK